TPPPTPAPVFTAQAKDNPPAPVPPVEMPVAVLTGNVVDPLGRPVPHAKVSVLARRWERGGPGLRDELIASAETGEDGQYRIPLAAFTVQTGSESRLHVIARSPANAATTIASIPLLPGEAPAPISLKLPDGKGIPGIVLDDADQPVSGAMVTVARFGG